MKLPLELSYIQMTFVRHREYLLWHIHLRMSGVGVSVVVLGTHPSSFLAILLLRTHALYSGSKRVTIPLSIFYTVSP